MKLKPLGDRLIVQALEEEDTTASGIVLPDTAKEKAQRGKVLAVGDGKWVDEGERRIPLDVSEGDEVLYSKYGGTEVTVEGDDLLVLREAEVLEVTEREGDGKRIPLDVSEADEVLYSKYGGTEVTVEGDDLLVLREADVLAKVAERESAGHEPAGSVGGPGTNVMLILSGPAAAALVASVREWTRQRGTFGEVLSALGPQRGAALPEAAVLQARRNAAARQRLIDEFGAWSSADIADLAGSRATNRAALANRWRSEGRVFSVPSPDGQLYPGFQFDEQTRPWPVIAATLAALKQAPDITPWQLALWFTSANGWLGAARPVDLLEADPEAVIRAADHESDLVA